MATSTDKKKAGIEIVQASYSAQGNFQDVTKEVQAMASNGSLNVNVSAQSIGILDPAPGIKKTFQVKAIINGGDPTILSKDDGETLAISAPGIPDEPDKPSTLSSVLTSLWYCLIAGFTIYISISSYHFGISGLKSQIAAYVLLLTSLLTFGIAGLIAVPSIVFIYSFMWPTAIDFSYMTAQ